MRFLTKKHILLGLAGLVLLLLAAYRLPPVYDRLSWRLDFAMAYVRGVVQPAGALPAPVASSLPPPRVVTLRSTLDPAEAALLGAGEFPGETSTPGPTPTPEASPTPTPSPTPIPGSVLLTAPSFEKQDINNCGPATLTMYLRYYGWEGDQFNITEVVKPNRDDRNVNIDELVYFTSTKTGWLNSTYRVGGDLDMLKRFLAAGIPVMIEEGFIFDETYWPNDDHWAAHYFLVTGYDDQAELFTGQDSFYGADRKVPYSKLDELWQSFNRAFVLVYLPEKEQTVRDILGENWDFDANRQAALETAERETAADPENAFAWFNLGTNLVYFERYLEAAAAYDKAREIGLPQRMLRYQFGPFIAYFRTNRQSDLLALTEYALERTPNAEEALLWHGWALYREGKTNEAIDEFMEALQHKPDYQDALYAIDFARQNP